MDEFSKTKIGFTVALLATVFTLKPLIDAYGDIGFIFFDFKITIELAFLITIGLLGVAVYFISIQFISPKQIPLLETISDYSYALSLSIPVVFIILWILVLTGGVLSTVLTIIPAVFWNIAIGVIAGLFASEISSRFRKAINTKSTESKQSDNRKKELELLSRAESLIDDGHFDLSLLESSKIMELALRQAVTYLTGESKIYPVHSLIKKAYELNLLSKTDVKHINEARVLRNNAAHLDSEVTKSQAEKAVITAKRLIKTLSFINDVDGFNWLQVNRTEALNSLRGNNTKKFKPIISHLLDAWLNRDGAIAGDISEFFEVALVNNPGLIIEMFVDNKDQLDFWINQLNTQMFTDYIGGRLSKLVDLKQDITTSLSKYMEVSSDETRRNIASKIKEKIETITPREID